MTALSVLVAVPLAFIAYMATGVAYLKLCGVTPESIIQDVTEDDEDARQEYALLTEREGHHFALLLFALISAEWPYVAAMDIYHGIRRHVKAGDR